jgi:alpha-1,2-mannosyltransferase
MLKLRNKKSNINSASTETASYKTQETKYESAEKRFNFDKSSHSFRVAFSLLLIVRTLSATLGALIGDCDEVFNYWEPLHYLQYGYGLQTWEYSPDYSIRSWAFILLYLLPAQFISKIYSVMASLSIHLVFGLSEKVAVFYAIRILLGVLCAYFESLFYRAIVDHLGSRIARYFLVLLICSPGMWISASGFIST